MWGGIIKKSLKWILVTPYWMPIVGGVTTCVVNLATELNNYNYVDVEVIALEGNDENICMNSRRKSTFVLKSFFIGNLPLNISF